MGHTSLQVLRRHLKQTEADFQEAYRKTGKRVSPTCDARRFTINASEPPIFWNAASWKSVDEPKLFLASSQKRAALDWHLPHFGEPVSVGKESE